MYFLDQRQLYGAVSETLGEIAKENYQGFQTALLLSEELSRALRHMNSSAQTKPLKVAVEQLKLWAIIQGQTGKLPSAGETCLSPFQLKLLADEIKILLEA